jgi:uncharacterized protein YqjF (DUF2071 family)
MPVIAPPAAACSGTTSQPWLWSQRWQDLLFAHWQVPAVALRPHVPDRLAIDTREGAAWVSAVAFRLARVRRRCLPPVWPASAFPELNLRTYVRHQGEAAICFLSIHAGRQLATKLARVFTPLPYRFAPICFRRDTGRFRFNCPRAGFSAEWTPEGPSGRVLPGSLDAWLLERYVLYAESVRGTLFRTVVRHPPWLVRRARPAVAATELGKAFGIELCREADAGHFSEGVHALVEPFVAVGDRRVARAAR